MIALLLMAALAGELNAEAEDPGLSAGEPAPEAAAGPTLHRSGSLPPDLARAALDARSLPLAQRMRAVSEPLLGLPYLADSHGEGRGVDPDPPARYDTFDCLTFVEEVLALSLSGDPTHAAQVRSALRWDGEPSYATRRHFMELQWIPDNLAAGWLVDTTDDYGRPVQRFEREVTAGTWRAWGRRSLFAHSDEQLPVGTMALDVLSLEDAMAVVDQLRPGTIVLTVRQDRPWIPIWITHLGFVLANAEQPTVRHATRMSSRVVRDHPLEWYVEHVGTYSNWPTAGIALLEPVEQGPRLSALEE